MSLWVDAKYANILGSYLPKFTKKSEYLWNFRCPICGDSKKNPNKCRGFIYRSKGHLVVKCHNCGYVQNLSTFLEHINPNLFKEYLFEIYREKDGTHVKEPEMPEIFQEMELSDAILDPLKRLDKMSINHPAVKYVLNRKIPSKLHHLFYFTTKFKQYCNSVTPNKFDSLDNDHPRLIIPFFNKQGKCFAFQGRAFGKEIPKYITIKIDENHDRIYGLERVNFMKPVYITEGPIDSLFIPNAIAVSGASYQCHTIEKIKDNCIIVPDNEPRNKDVCRLIHTMINKDYKVCLWPDTFEYKDINDAIKDGLTSADVLSIINANIYQGASAKLRFVRWKK